ncbi:MAG TPA: HAMP domain-containing sensor histidine kinase [Ktedonobacteraceae bacterium]|nr:HAMP domain-containing sensor histidine kinase [Ktedonobacteraceae bacterium]
MDQSVLPPPAKSPPVQHLTPVASLARLRGRRFWLLPLGTLLFVGLLIIIQAWAGGSFSIVVTGVAPILALAVAFWGTFWVSLRLPKGQARLAWRCISVAFLCYLVAEVIEAVLALAGITLPPPTPADPFIVLFYPFLIVGLLLLLSPESSQGARGRLIVEVGIITIAALGLSLVAIITPLWNIAASLSLLGKLFLTAYPLGDVALIATVVLLLLRVTEPALRPVLLWIALGVGLFVYADSALYILALHVLYRPESALIDPFSAGGELLMGLSAWFYLIHGGEPGTAWTWLTRTRQAAVRAPWQRWLLQFVFPYFPILLLLIFIIAREQLPSTEEGSAYVLEGLALGIILLMITRQTLLSKDLVDAQEANERARQLDALKDQFITSVNHELRTPLMTMQTYVELLRYRQKELPERTGKLVAEIGRTNDALVDLVQSILEVRRLDQESQDFPHEVVNLHHALTQAAALIPPREGNIAERTLQVELSPNLAVWGETVRVQQILTNLLSNATKYSPAGSTIEVSATVVRAEGNRRSKTGKEQSMVEIQVRDYGLGIPSEQIPLLFHRFVRLPRDLASNVVGSGLGLYLCQNLTEGMGGRIWVESPGIPGQGSTFHVQLPLAERTVSQPLPEPSTAAQEILNHP